ncbi:MAG TPA: hypothetical protein VGX28_16960 [Frankiaceae bacterium]|jgi:hypothetical protein|nr:hypothetical protein [Frankiaceae bacterium]
MRRLLIPLVLLAGLPLGAGTASACAQPAEGEPVCCPPRYLLVVDQPPLSIYVQDPTQNPADCSRVG